MENKFIFTLVVSFSLLFLATTQVHATTIAVNPGESIQNKCLNMVKAGDTCLINPGTYTEALTLKTTGTSSAPITLTCTTVKECIINSGSSKTLTISSSGRIGYYTFDGFRFLSTASGDQSYSTITFDAGGWDGDSASGGYNGYTLKNCYIEGSVLFYGHNNLIENCELNGNNVQTTAITEKYQQSHHNIFRNNKICNYKGRGLWSMQYVTDTVVDGNEIYYVGRGYDPDGAGVPVHNIIIKNNIFHDIDREEKTGIEFENCFNCLAEKNIFYNAGTAISIMNYGKEPNFTAEGEWRDDDTHTIMRNNLIYNSTNGIICHKSPGGTAINNTIYNSGSSSYAGIALTTPLSPYYCTNWVIKNNIVVNNKGAGIYVKADPPNYNINLTSDYNIFNIGENFHLHGWIGDTSYNIDKNISEWQSLGYDVHSTITDSLLFINSSVGDFHLQSNSPACTAGEGDTYVGAFPCASPTPSPSTPASPPAGKPGDANNDSLINGIDYVVWLTNYNKTITGGATVGDFNNSGKVDGTDYVMWVNNYGN